MTTPLPDALLRQAFEALAIRTPALHAMGYAQAMAHRTWGRVIAAKAAQDRAAHYRATTTRRVALLRRCNPATGAWVTQRVPGPFDTAQPTFPTTA